MTETEPEKPPMDKTVLSIMEMPTISGINLKMSCIKVCRYVGVWIVYKVRVVGRRQ